MKVEVTFGAETADQHFSRASLSLQGVMTFANFNGGDYPVPVKGVHHIFGDHGCATDHHFTLSTIQLFLNQIENETAFNLREFKKIIFFCDGSEQQNWSGQVMGGVAKQIRALQDRGLLPNLKELLMVKTSPGHGKVILCREVNKYVIKIVELFGWGIFSSKTGTSSGSFDKWCCWRCCDGKSVNWLCRYEVGGAIFEGPPKLHSSIRSLKAR